MKSMLTIAGSDPSGGAGIQVDLQVFRDFDRHGTSVLTAVIWQNTQGVRGFRSVEAEHVREQMRTLCDDVPVAGVKIGMLPTSEVVRVVADTLGSLPDGVPVVFDPVLASGSGSSALRRSGTEEAMRDRLLSEIDVLTPNIPEAEALLEVGIETREEAKRAARALRRLGPEGVLVKTGHLPNEARSTSEGDTISDLLALESRVVDLAPLETVDADVRGTGCQLSSALAALLVEGRGLRTASEEARRYLNDKLHTSTRPIGKGRPVVVRTSETTE